MWNFVRATDFASLTSRLLISLSNFDVVYASLLNHTVRNISSRISLVKVRVLACHRHVDCVESVASLPHKCLFVLHLISIVAACVLKLLKFFLCKHLKILAVLCHLRWFSDVFWIEVTLKNSRHMRRYLALVEHRLPIYVSTPRVSLDSPNLALCNPPTWVFVQHQAQ